MTDSQDISQLTQLLPFEAEIGELEEAQGLARRCGLPFLSLHDLVIDPALMKKVPREVLETYQMVPLREEDGTLTVAMSDPLDVVGEDMMRFATGCKIKRVVSPASHIEQALKGEKKQPESLLDTILRRIPESEITYIESAEASSQRQEQESAELEPTAPVIQLVSSIIGDAIRMGASDIHVEPLKQTMRIRYRLDGYLRTIVELPQRVQGACITRLKIISGLDISESRKPQDGRTRAVLEGREVDMRVSTLPTYFGEKVVLRILDPKAVMVDLENLGLIPEDLASVKQTLASSQGMLLCTGPTGSGKTSTLYSALLHLNEESDNVVTVEDPIEYQLEGINQVQVNVRAGVTFASALRSILRQDPDVVLIGEIRDLETAEIAVQSAQTGHLVLSTLHTNDAISTINRLVLMGIQPYLLASSLLCVIAQRLVRKLCPYCRELGAPSEASLELLRTAGISQLPTESYQARGCEHCNYVGYRGRMGLFEILTVTDRVRQLLLEQASESEIESLARSEGMRSLLEDGLAKCANGSTSLDEVLRILTIRRAGGRRCPECQTAVSIEYPFCGFCGASVVHLCGRCQTPLQPDWHFCAHCREPLAVTPVCPTAEVAEPQPEGPLPPPPGEPLPAQKWVLLISQDSVLRTQLATCLLEEEYCVLTAEEDAHALALVHSHMPDLVILDLEMTSFEVAAWMARLRSQLDCSLIPVLLLSELGQEGVKGLGLGADSLMVKPFSEGRFLHRVTALLESNPRMAGPPKQLTPLGPVLHLPGYLTDPLRRVLGAAHLRHYEVALSELGNLAQRITQYCFSLTVSALRLCQGLPAAPLWAPPRGMEALLEKSTTLAERVAELEQQTTASSGPPGLLEVVREGACLAPALRELWEILPPESARKARVAHGIGLIRPWLETVRAFCAQSEHLLDEPDNEGAVSGSVQCGEWVLTFDEPALYLYTRVATST